jgi:hypothetical protein
MYMASHCYYVSAKKWFSAGSMIIQYCEVRTMRDQEEQSLKEIKRKEKRIEEEAGRLAKERGRKKAYLLREEAIEKASKASKTRRTEKQAAEEIGQSAKDQARKKANLAREQAIAEAEKASKSKAKNQS